MRASQQLQPKKGAQPQVVVFRIRSCGFGIQDRSNVQGAFFNCSSRFSIPKWKNLLSQQGAFFTLKISWTSNPDWLQLVFHFGTENREEQSKEAPCIFHNSKHGLMVWRRDLTKENLYYFHHFPNRAGRGRGEWFGQCNREFLRSSLRATVEPFATEIASGRASGGDKNVNQSKVGRC